MNWFKLLFRKKSVKNKYADISKPIAKIEEPTLTNNSFLNELKEYSNKKIAYHNLNKKRINTRTGYPLAKQSSIDRTLEALNEQLNAQPHNYMESLYYNGLEGLSITIDDYLLSINLPYFYAGTLAYKQGDWDLAEKWWVMVLDIRPANSSSKLEIMYRKQKRYTDIVSMYAAAIKDAEVYFKLTGIDSRKEMQERYKLCKKEAEKKSANDVSKGITNYPSLIDMTYIKKLQIAAMNSPYNGQTSN